MNKRFLLLLFSLLSYTLAIAQSVDTTWVRRFNGQGNGDDQGKAITVDNYGNVYLTGYSYGSGTDKDYATIKYYPNGDTAWVRRYNGPGNFWDEASAITVDTSGNVYVTGWSYPYIFSPDYATIKYYPNGEPAWERRYNGPGNSYDEARAIASDRSGNVYVTGYSNGILTDRDYATIKYYPNGDTAWVRRYNGPGNKWDEARAIAVDASGNIYVTGWSDGNGTHSDYFTIKYYPNGDTAWVRRYNGPANQWDDAYAMAIDSSGNVYVTGISDGIGSSRDYATVKYYSNGDTAWVRRYNGPGNYWDIASAITVDRSGNVYVTGWSDRGSAIYDYATIKYYPNGDTAWLRRYTGPGGYNDRAYAIAVNGSGNVYVTGWSEVSWSSNDYATVKYNSNGDIDWVRTYNGPAEQWDEAYTLAVDDSNNVYVTGWSYGSETYYDYLTIKYVQFLRGDANWDNVVSLSDCVYLIAYLYKGGPLPQPILSAGDANCDEKVTLSDIVYTMVYLYKGGPAPCR